MRKLLPGLFVVLMLLLASLLLPQAALASPADKVTTISSDGNAYTLQLTSNSDADGILSVIHLGKELMRYQFEGKILDVYWSPSHKYVAFNNINGHDGFYVWVIALDSGKLMSKHGLIGDLDYKRYTDEDYSQSLLNESLDAIRKVYRGVDGDSLHGFERYLVYGWKDDHHLLVWTNYWFLAFYNKTGGLIEIYATLHVDEPKVFSFEDIVAKIDPSGGAKDPLEEIRKAHALSD